MPGVDMTEREFRELFKLGLQLGPLARRTAGEGR